MQQVFIPGKDTIKSAQILLIPVQGANIGIFSCYQVFWAWNMVYFLPIMQNTKSNLSTLINIGIIELNTVF